MNTIYQETDYLKFVHVKIAENEAIRGYKGQLAVAAGCKSSYFSHVMSGMAHFTPEHALGLAQYWGLNEQETEYFIQLVNLGRAGTPALQAYYKNKLNELRARYLNLAKKFKNNPELDQELILAYYSNWYYSAIHILSSIPDFQTAPAMAQRLSLSLEIVHEALNKLESMKLVKKKGNRWLIDNMDMHLPKKSPLHMMNMQNWRARAVLNAQNSIKQDLHYTCIHSLSRADVEQLKFKLTEFIESSRKIVAASPEEELVCVNIDCFLI